MGSPENLKSGYVRLYRSSFPWLRNHKLWAFWCYCLLKASHKVHKVLIGNQQIELKPGQFIFGRKIAAKETGLSEQSIRTCMHSLATLENLTIKTTNKYSLITVINWELYQSDTDKATSKSTCKQPATNHIQECNNVILLKNTADSSESPSLKLDAEKQSYERPKTKKPKATDPRISSIIAYFIETVDQERGFKPLVDGKDGAAVKRALKTLDEEGVKAAIRYYLSSPKAAEHGANLSTALSKDSINKFMGHQAGGNGNGSASPVQPGDDSPEFLEMCKNTASMGLPSWE